MNEPTILFNNIQALKTSTQDHIKQIKSRLNNAPAGCLRISGKRSRSQYYHRTDPSDKLGTYIPRKDQDIAVKLAQKDYDIRLLKVLEKQLKIVERLLNDYDPKAALRVYEELTDPRKKLVTPEFLPDDEFVKQWFERPYKKLGFKKDEPEYYTAKGERVRSKSEILIADALARHNIPYRYEYPIIIDGVPVAAPDFNCLNVRLRKDYYWEHLGMMGDNDYANKNVRKLNRYTLADGFDESRLILTFETVTNPLDTRVIEEKIERFLI